MSAPESKLSAENDATGSAEANAERASPQRSRYKILLRVIAALVVAGFIAWSARGLAQRWSQSPQVDLAWGWVLASALPLLLSSWFQALGWLQIVRRLGASDSLKSLPAVRLFLASLLGRYVPGKVGMPAILIGGAPAIGMPRAVVGSSLLLMMVVYVVTGLAVGLSGIALSSSGIGGHDLLSEVFARIVTGVLVAATLLLAFVDRRYLPGKLQGLLGNSAGTLLPWSSIVFFALASALWLIHGVCLALSVGGTWAAAWSSSGFFAVAPVIGVLALVTPGGIGVREAVIVSGCTPWLGAAPALTVALLSRVISLLVEIAAWLGAVAIERSSGSRTDRT